MSNAISAVRSAVGVVAGVPTKSGGSTIRTLFRLVAVVLVAAELMESLLFEVTSFSGTLGPLATPTVLAGGVPLYTELADKSDVDACPGWMAWCEVANGPDFAGGKEGAAEGMDVLGAGNKDRVGVENKSMASGNSMRSGSPRSVSWPVS